MSQSSLPPPLAPIRRSAYHAWVPQTNEAHNQFVKDLIDNVRRSPRTAHVPSVIQFDSDLSDDQKQLFTDALRQVKKYYAKWADPDSIVDTYDDFLDLLDGIVTSAPRFYRANIRGVTIGEPVGVPLYLILDLISNTSAAYTLFTQQSFNAALKKLLDSWGAWLTTSDSSYTLANEWFSQEGLQLLESGLGGKTFDETFEIEVDPPQRYNSWDSFFTRRLKSADVRPIYPSDDPSVIFLYNACESTVFRTATDVQLNDTFWLKTQNYSLFDILGGDDPNSFAGAYGEQLVGSSAYQAFLSPADYHRWNSPFEADVESYVFDGTYYAVLPDDGAPLYDPDLEPGDPHGAIIRSQPWLTVAATRAVFILKPTDPNSPIKLAAFVAIGMVEVSTCEVTYDKTTSHVSIGDELGTFHFGGSSYVLFIQPKDNYKLVFQDFYNVPIRPGQHRWINSIIGQFWKQD